MDKEFYLIRHAQSLGNIGMDSGNDPDLSPLGHAQAKQCAAFMQDYCDERTLLLCSPFERCLTTADAIAHANNLRIKIEIDLHEMFAKEWFTMSRIKMDSLRKKAERHPLVTGEYPDGSWWPQKTETQEEVQIRMAMLRNRLLSNEYNAEKIICIGHWASIASLAHSMVSDIDLPIVDNARITAIHYIDGHFQLNFANKS